MPKKLKVNKTLKKTRKIKNQKGGTIIEVINPPPNTIKDVLESFKIIRKNEFNPNNDIFAKLYLRTTDRGDIPIAIWNNNCAHNYIEPSDPLLKTLDELIEMQKNIVLKYTKTNLDTQAYPFF